MTYVSSSLFWDTKSLFWDIKSFLWDTKSLYWDTKSLFWDIKSLYWDTKSLFQVRHFEKVSHYNDLQDLFSPHHIDRNGLPYSPPTVWSYPSEKRTLGFTSSPWGYLSVSISLKQVYLILKFWPTSRSTLWSVNSEFHYSHGSFHYMIK